jgi:hypothetical protein
MPSHGWQAVEAFYIDLVAGRTCLSTLGLAPAGAAAYKPQQQQLLRQQQQDRQVQQQQQQQFGVLLDTAGKLPAAAKELPRQQDGALAVEKQQLQHTPSPQRFKRTTYKVGPSLKPLRWAASRWGGGGERQPAPVRSASPAAALLLHGDTEQPQQLLQELLLHCNTPCGCCAAALPRAPQVMSSCQAANDKSGVKLNVVCVAPLWLAGAGVLPWQQLLRLGQAAGEDVRGGDTGSSHSSCRTHSRATKLCQQVRQSCSKAGPASSTQTIPCYGQLPR